MIECLDVVKEFGKPPQRVLHGISVRVEDGTFLSITGRSGSGKSTLLYLISTLDVPTSGSVLLDGHDTATWAQDELHAFRNRRVGFIFQFHFLLPELTALENVLLPARNLGIHAEKERDALALLERMNIGQHARKFPGQMSGGEQQRVAIARALVMKPSYIFADEPTGNLDTENATLVMEILKEENRRGATICLVTHEPDFAAMASREVFLTDGRISGTR